jgi:hypothetical protein
MRPQAVNRLRGGDGTLAVFPPARRRSGLARRQLYCRKNFRLGIFGSAGIVKPLAAASIRGVLASTVFKAIDVT